MRNGLVLIRKLKREDSFSERVKNTMKRINYTLALVLKPKSIAFTLILLL